MNACSDRLITGTARNDDAECFTRVCQAMGRQLYEHDQKERNGNGSCQCHSTILFNSQSSLSLFLGGSAAAAVSVALSTAAASPVAAAAETTKAARATVECVRLKILSKSLHAFATSYITAVAQELAVKDAIALAEKRVKAQTNGRSASHV